MYQEMDLMERILELDYMFIVFILFMCCNKPYDSVKYFRKKERNYPPCVINVKFHPDGCDFSTINHAVWVWALNVSGYLVWNLCLLCCRKSFHVVQFKGEVSVVLYDTNDTDHVIFLMSFFLPLNDSNRWDIIGHPLRSERKHPCTGNGFSNMPMKCNNGRPIYDILELNYVDLSVSYY